MIKAKVTAENALSFGTTSVASSSLVYVRVKPLKPVASPYRGTTTDSTQIDVRWNELLPPTANGGSAILSYNLQWDAGTGVTNVNLVGWSSPYLHDYYTVTSGITSGIVYKFKYRA